MIRLLEKTFLNNDICSYTLECLNCGKVFHDNCDKNIVICSRCFSIDLSSKILESTTIRVFSKKEV